MDPRDQRQAQPPNLPFSRNAQSPLYTRQTLPPPTPSSASATPAPNSYAIDRQQQQQQQPGQHTQAPSASSAYPPDNLQRRPSDPHFFPSSRPYEHGASLTPSNHSRHQSSSSVTPAPPMNRGMPPPGSPPQPGQGPGGPGGPGLQMGPGGPYSLPAPRPSPISGGPSTAFPPGGRELPALDSIQRGGGQGSSMSLNYMLGPRPRDSAAPSYPPPASSAAASAPSYTSGVHASPRMASISTEYAPYRRPHTPEQHQRMYEARDPRADPRADLRTDPRGDPRDQRDARTAAGSPHGAHLTPEMQRYGTPRDAYRHPPPPMGPTEHARDFQRLPGPPGPPPRPSSQPKSFPNIAPPTRQMEMGRPGHPDMYPRREEPRHGGEYNPERLIVVKHEDDRLMFERERQEREREMELRDRERRERTTSGGDPGRQYGMNQPEYGPPGIQRREPLPPQYSRPLDAREQAHWQRPAYDQPRHVYEEPRPQPRQHEYAHASAPPYNNAQGALSQPPGERYPPSSHPAHPQSMPQTAHQAPPYESPNRHRAPALPPHQQQQPPHRRPGEDGPPPPSVAYSNGHPTVYDSPRHRPLEEPGHPMAHQQNFLRVQEMNRKGRISPLPQAVQGAQPQIQGPPGEAGIKSEFGRMFSGIGSGVSGLGVSSPVAAGAQLPFTSSGLGRRDDLEHAPPDVTSDPKGGRDNASRNKRRKQKEDEVKNDEDSTGRSTPLGRAKRQKTHSHHHHHQYVSSHPIISSHITHIVSHHHHHHHIPDQVSPQQAVVTPFKNVKGSTPIPSPTGAAKDLLMTHHHAPPRSSAHGQIREPNVQPIANHPNAPVVIPPKPKRIISNKAILDSVSHKPREHLGDWIYDVVLKPARIYDGRSGRHARHAYQSTPKPLPMPTIQGKEGSTLMVKVGKQHLKPSARAEITSRRALWGTDVYTDDSDVVAACIHGGWIRGEWADDVDINLLGLDEGIGADVKDAKGSRKGRGKETAESLQKSNPEFLEAPLATGPVQAPEGRDMHVMIQILPKLEKYVSTVRFGIKSREWGGKLGRDGQRSSHDGLSFMIKSVRFVTNGAAPQSRLRGQARRDRMRKAMQEVEMSRAFEVRVVPNTGSGIVSLAPKKKAANGAGDKENRSLEDAGHGEGHDKEAHNGSPGGSRARGSLAEGQVGNGGEADRNEQHNRDDDSGVGDVSGAGDDPNVPAALNAAATLAAVATVASRLTPPAEA